MSDIGTSRPANSQPGGAGEAEKAGMAGTDVTAGSVEERVLHRYGYRQELKRAMGPLGAFSLSFSGIGITVSIFATIAFLWTQGGPAGIWTWPIASVFYILLGLVFGEISSKIPVTGYSYQWGSKLANPHVGFIVGFFAYIAFQVGVVGTDLTFAPFFASTFGFTPSTFQIVLIAAAAFVVQGGLLVWGIAIASKVNSAAVMTEIIGGLGTGAALLIRALVTHHHTFSYAFNIGFARGGSHYLVPFACPSCLQHLSIAPGKRPRTSPRKQGGAVNAAPKAMIRALSATAVIGMVMLLGFTLAMPSLKATLAFSFRARLS